MDTPYFSSKRYLLLTDSLTALVATAINAILVGGGTVMCVTSDQRIKNEVQTKVGVPVTVVRIKGGDEIDFYNHHMPGSMEDLYFDDFPLWKGLSIDRLRFWHVDKNEALFLLSMLDYDEAILDLNMMTNISSVYEDVNCPTTVLKNGTLRTPAHLDFLTAMGDRLTRVVTNREIDIDYLKAIKDVEVSVWRDEDPLILPTERDREKNLSVVYYDKQYAWQFNEVFPLISVNSVVTYDKRSAEVFPLCHFGAKIIDAKLVENNVNTLIMFGYDEGVIDKINPHHVIIHDKRAVNSARIMARGDKRVEVLDE